MNDSVNDVFAAWPVPTVQAKEFLRKFKRKLYFNLKCSDSSCMKTDQQKIGTVSNGNKLSDLKVFGPNDGKLAQAWIVKGVASAAGMYAEMGSTVYFNEPRDQMQTDGGDVTFGTWMWDDIDNMDSPITAKIWHKDQ